MRDFFKNVLSTVVGVFISFFILFCICCAILIYLVASVGNSPQTIVSKNSVLYLDLNQQVLERTPDRALAKLPLFGSGEQGIGLLDLIKGIEQAKTDDNIKAIFLNVSAPQAGHASLREIRNALIAFKKSGKSIIAYSETYSQQAYYLASAANKIYLNPEGDLEFKGFSSQVMFFKGALEKLGVEAQIIRVGEYKSAVEPFFLDKMSENNRSQVSAYVNGLYQTFISDIAESRKIPRDSLLQIANEFRIQGPADALKYKFVDGLKYKDELIAEMKQLTGKDKKTDISTIGILNYLESKSNVSTSANEIAVIYANGEINGGEGNDQVIGSERISRAIRSARNNENVKAIVLRINSPGGSALASDVIWREVILAKKEKPVMASFGDVAASGGYYIGCAADSIFVQPNTITGSIGVFGIIPNFQNLLNNKLGLTFDGVKTSEYADIMDTTRPMTQGERFIIQKQVDKVYSTFLQRVADGRKKDIKYIDSIGGGHVWVGTHAIKIGLADRVGSFESAIAAAAKKANLKDYKLSEYPAKMNIFDAILEQGKDRVRSYYMQRELGESYKLYEHMQKVLSTSGIQARMPFNLQAQ